MKERPILFSGPMVNAIYDGRKTQTRRVIKPQPKTYTAMHRFNRFLKWKDVIDAKEFAAKEFMVKYCPYGILGDRLWVRETWAVGKRLDDRPPRELEFLTANKDFPQSTIYYRADSDNGINPLRGKWRPSIHMPRWASRITLEMTDVRIERVQDIGIGDAVEEGIDEIPYLWTDLPELPKPSHFIDAFHVLWDSLNAKRGFSWESNPWVWVVELALLGKQEVDLQFQL